MPINKAFAKDTLADCSSVHMSRQQICRVTGNRGLIEKAPSVRSHFCTLKLYQSSHTIQNLIWLRHTGLRGMRD
jgi:hypothetical protein